MPKRQLLTEMNLINGLLDVYGPLLTHLQQAMMSDYYRFNLSLQEIADQRQITRAAVSDALTQAKHHLMKFEKTLKVVALQSTLKTWINDDTIPASVKKKLIQFLNR
jgi:predicted DNA-binding protein YlxM (UPF0122 family)